MVYCFLYFCLKFELTFYEITSNLHDLKNVHILIYNSDVRGLLITEGFVFMILDERCAMTKIKLL